MAEPRTPIITTRSTYPDIDSRADVLSAVALASDYTETQAAAYGVVLDWSRAAIETRPAGDAMLVRVAAPSSLSPLVELHTPGNLIDALSVPEGHDCHIGCGGQHVERDQYGRDFTLHRYTPCSHCLSGVSGFAEVAWPCPTLRAAGVTKDYRTLGPA
ncbi:hypothetical protein [Nocardioides massiliensis]|uniref:Uncharacterized protein n=1 Tax=Nocardioides massiliensis TaxID=1325935 RepID=A0ABT9NJL8_9ACTN|nr:hypothetical protein [Nocardioides massiliensis]MDP9820412.1 hypothetical protein [Nocardioides massiliensis]